MLLLRYLALDNAALPPVVQPPQLNGGNQLIASGELDALQAIAKSREENIVSLEGELSKCREELLARRMEVSIVGYAFACVVSE